MKNTELKDSLNQLADVSLNVVEKPKEYNLIILNTPTGKMQIKTHLTSDEWLKEQNLKLKPKTRCKRK
jgi:hypothetical protein